MVLHLSQVPRLGKEEIRILLSSDVRTGILAAALRAGKRSCGCRRHRNPFLRFLVITFTATKYYILLLSSCSQKMSHSPDEMLPPKELQRLPQEPLISPTGARLVLDNNNAGYPDHTDPSCAGRGRWVDNIASTDTKTFLRAGNCEDVWLPWVWPAVVLTPEEYKLRVGGMSVTELRRQLEKYWGRGGIPGAAADDDYQDMWVPAWAPENTDDPYHLSWDPMEEPTRLDPTIFSHWVNRATLL